MGESERDAEVRLVNSLRLAAFDMKPAHLAATSILDPQYKDLRMLLETALAVSYTRPFTTSHARLNLGREWEPEDANDLDLHRDLLELRDTVYAHTDATTWRTVVSIGSIIPGRAERPRC